MTLALAWGLSSLAGAQLPIAGNAPKPMATGARPKLEQPLPPLVERLGFPADARVLILNVDDFGMNHGANVGTIMALKAGGMTSATVMVPCPWFPEAAEFARKTPQANVGIHLTLTSEWKRYKWGPVVGREGAPSLCDEQGYLHSDVPMVYIKARPEEVEKEVRAQIQKALDAGIDVTHVDSHMGTLQYAPGYHEMYLRIAKDFNLPCRTAGRELMRQYGGEYLIDMADALGVLHPDFLFQGDPPTLEDTERWWKEERLSKVQPGMVTEIFIHAGRETPEMEATTGSWRRRSADADFFSRPETVQWIKEQGIHLISYRDLRELQRTGKPMPRVEKYGW
jgi:predicted glycoside hydrolase/deacetylase ChbG (UPF0249 family)